MCTYNGDKYLEEQLESIANQTRLPDEMIICDDKSKDGTLDILRNFKSKVSFSVRLFFNEKNLGSTKNFEKAIKLCTGDIIFLSDQDDVWYPNKLEKIEKLFYISPSTAAIFTDAELVDDNLRSLGYSMWQSIGFNKREQNRFIHGKFIEVLLKQNVVTGSTMAFRSELRRLFFPIPDTWFHDAWITLLIAFVSDLNMISEPLIKYRQHHMQQIGAGNKYGMYNKICCKIKQLKNLITGNYNYHPECVMYTQAYTHLVTSQFPSTKINKISLLRDRASHSCVRANLPISRKERIPFIVKELVNKNYQRYSNGIFSFGGDLLRTNTKFKGKNSK